MSARGPPVPGGLHRLLGRGLWWVCWDDVPRLEHTICLQRSHGPRDAGIEGAPVLKLGVLHQPVPANQKMPTPTNGQQLQVSVGERRLGEDICIAGALGFCTTPPTL